MKTKYVTKMPLQKQKVRSAEGVDNNTEVRELQV
jgi:hypothetical protein